MTHSFPTRRSSDLLACHVLPAPNTALGRALAGVAAHDQPAYLGIGIGEVARQAEAIDRAQDRLDFGALGNQLRSEEHTSELQSLMRSSYAVFCLKKKRERMGLTSSTVKRTSTNYRHK